LNENDYQNTDDENDYQNTDDENDYQNTDDENDYQNTDNGNLYSDFVKRNLQHTQCKRSVFRFREYDVNISENHGKCAIDGIYDIFDLLFLVIEFKKETELNIESIIDWIKLNGIYMCTGYYLESRNKFDTQNKFKELNSVYYIKIPFVHSKNHFFSMVTCKYDHNIMNKFNIDIKFKNTDFKNICIMCRSHYLEREERENLALSTLDLLIHNPIEIRSKNINNKIIFNIDTTYSIRDFEFVIKGMKCASLWCDDQMKWCYDSLILGHVLPKEVLKRELEKDHYYYSFSDDHDFTTIRGYGNFRNIKSCRLEIELFDGLFIQEAILIYHQVYIYRYHKPLYEGQQNGKIIAEI
jgi:hypothetical protein